MKLMFNKKNPKWLEPHLYGARKFSELDKKEIEALKARISRFQSLDPEVSIVIPAWNEENNIFRTLSSLASNTTTRNAEIVVINNNSTDNTQLLLDTLGVRNYFQPAQGIAFARQLGLDRAKGKYHLCADSDSFYPPDWMELMCKPLCTPDHVVGVYGRYSFLPPAGQSRLPWYFYEKVTGILVRLRKKRREHINFLGFNMGFITQVGRDNGGFNVRQARTFNNAAGSDNYVDESEDGRMAVNLMKTGQLKLIVDPKARVYTSSRRIIADGGLFRSFTSKLLKHSGKLFEYFRGKAVE